MTQIIEQKNNSVRSRSQFVVKRGGLSFQNLAETGHITVAIKYNASLHTRVACNLSWIDFDFLRRLLMPPLTYLYQFTRVRQDFYELKSKPKKVFKIKKWLRHFLILVLPK
jgi:hypothetical protein